MKNVIPSKIWCILQGKDGVLINVQVLKLTPTRTLTLQLMVGGGPALPRLCNMGLPGSDTCWRFAGAHISKTHLPTCQRSVESPQAHDFPHLSEIFIPISVFPQFSAVHPSSTLQALPCILFHFCCFQTTLIFMANLFSSFELPLNALIQILIVQTNSGFLYAVRTDYKPKLLSCFQKHGPLWCGFYAPQSKHFWNPIPSLWLLLSLSISLWQVGFIDSVLTLTVKSWKAILKSWSGT